MTGPRTGGWKSGPRPIGRASASNLAGGAVGCDACSVDPQPPTPSTTTKAVRTLRQALDVTTVEVFDRLRVLFIAIGVVEQAEHQ